MKRISLLLPILLISCMSPAQKSAITFTGGDRLGDKLFTYCRAKWLAHTYDLTFLCPDFPFRSTLMLVDNELPYSKQNNKQFSHIKIIKRESDIVPGQEDTLYIMDFFMQLDIVPTVFDHRMLINFKNDPEFLSQLCASLAPRDSIDALTLPQDMPTIAVHVRRGGGYYMDDDKAFKRWPLKFPPDAYYIDQIKRIAARHDADQPLYIYLFTDDKDPKAIVENYKEALQLPNLIFAYRDQNKYQDHVLDDMFAMAQFDYLIRSNSQFTFISIIVGNHKLILSPYNATWHGDNVTIDRVWIIENQADGSITQAFIDTP